MKQKSTTPYSGLGLAALALFVGSEQCHALGIKVLGGVNSASFKSDAGNAQGNSYSSSAALSIGAGLEFDILPSLLALELDGFYTSTKINIANTVAPVNVSLKTNALESPLLVKFTALPIVKFGAGVQYATGLGKITAESDNALAIASGEYDYASAPLSVKKTSLSAVLAASAEISIAPTLALVLEGRYCVGLSNLDDPETPGQTSKINQIKGYGGLSFRL